MNIQPVNIASVEKYTDNVYESVIVAARKARLINAENKLQFNALISTIIPAVEDEFDERENPDQTRISLEFENKPKPHLLSLNELIEGKIDFRYKEDPEVEQ